MKTFILKIILIVLLVFVSRPAQAAYPVEIYFFYSQNCPVCYEAGMFLGSLVKKYPEIKIKDFEMTNPENQMIYFAFGQAYNLNLNETPVPFILIGEKSFTSYAPAISSEIEQTAIKCLSLGCASPMEKLDYLTDEKTNKNKTSKIIVWLLISVIIISIFFLLKKPKKINPDF
ncbi:MAG: hypothetical protein PHW15_01425 [Patescibacteria group bacterium]|nr:hypothetical protein [Patescibacteria group bacterium]